jgi:hypothetical protein
MEGMTALPSMQKKPSFWQKLGFSYPTLSNHPKTYARVGAR